MDQVIRDGFIMRGLTKPEKELVAENERLRAALHKIAEHPDTPELIRQYAVSQQLGENDGKN